jgi:hypothetical protein
MSDRDTRRHLVDLTVWTVCAVAIAGSFIAVQQTDRERAERKSKPSLTTTLEVPEEPESTVDEPRVNEIGAAPRPPTTRLQPVRRPVRRRIVIRRSRPS